MSYSQRSGGNKLVDKDGHVICTQHPLSTDGDSVYEKDLDIDNCSTQHFVGDISSLFSNRTSIMVSNYTNPAITIALKRPVTNQAIILVTSSGSFSNVKIIAKNAAGTTLETIDDSANNTAYTSHKYNFTTIDKWCVLEISFTTANIITLSFIDIYKSIHTHAHIHALKPDGTVTEIDATAGGNLKVSVEEVEQPTPTPDVTPATGVLAINTTTAIARKFTLKCITCHFNAAPVTSEDFVVTLDALDGAVYDTILYSIDPSVESVTDLVWIPDGELIFEDGDEIKVTYANTDGRTYGLRIVVA